MTDQIPEVTLTPEQEARALAIVGDGFDMYESEVRAARLIVHLQDRVRALESESIERFDQARYYAELASCRYLHWTCKTHGDFDARVAVGCPECVRMMREERASTPPAESERTLRRLLAFAHSGGHLYGDDGELQDSRLPHPIDYVRDSVAEIERKINARGMDRLLEESSLLRRCYNELPNPEHESDFDKRQRLRQLLPDLAKIIEWLPRAAVTTGESHG